MDYNGLGSRHQYLVDRPLTPEEKGARYRQKRPVHAEPMDYLSVIKINSTYIELVDRWYHNRGFWAWTSIVLGGLCLFASFGLIYFFFLGGIESSAIPQWSFYAATVFILLFQLLLWWGVWYGFRLEFLRWTHYPMRLNRKTRMVYVFRTDGSVLTVPWDDLYLTRSESKNPMAGTTYDLRAHVLDSDGETVKESFSLGYVLWTGKAQSVDQFWAFLQPYMEAKDGVERTHNYVKNAHYVLPVEGRKEGWRWSIALGFMIGAHWPWLQLLLSPVLCPNALGRVLAMWTSKVPKWPQEVEDANPVDPDDPYVMTWRDNAPLGWWEFWWPLLCTLVGIGVIVKVFMWIFAS